MIALWLAPVLSIAWSSSAPAVPAAPGHAEAAEGGVEAAMPQPSEMVPALLAGVIVLVPAETSALVSYPYVGVSLAIPVGGFLLIPSLSVEWSPELGAWGLVAVVTLDVPLRDGFGLDLSVNFVHDQVELHWRDAAFFAGAGLGISWSSAAWTISPFMTVLHGLNVPGWYVTPGITVSYAL